MASALRLRNSVLAEVLLIAFVYLVGVLRLAPVRSPWIWRPGTPCPRTAAAGCPWPAGGIVCVSLPLFQFILFRWYFRLFVWMALRLARGSVRARSRPHAPGSRGRPRIPFEHGLRVRAVAAGPRGDARRDDRQPDLLPRGNAAGLQGRAGRGRRVPPDRRAGPAPAVHAAPGRARRIGLREYGTLGQRYVREFDQKWLRGGARADEPLVGSGDIQSLADLGNSFEVVQRMRLVPFTKETILQLAVDDPRAGGSARPHHGVAGGTLEAAAAGGVLISAPLSLLPTSTILRQPEPGVPLGARRSPRHQGWSARLCRRSHHRPHDCGAMSPKAGQLQSRGLAWRARCSSLRASRWRLRSGGLQRRTRRL